MFLSFVERRELAPTIWEYTFEAERPIDFVAGQYVSIGVPGVTDDPRGQSRVYTLTSQPGETMTKFILKLPEPHSPHKEALFQMKPGDVASCHDAMGDLILPKNPNLPLVFVAGGIGIASFVSILQQLIQKREERSIFMFYALRERHERIFADLLKAYPLQLNTMVIAPNRLTAQQIMDSTPPDALIYISGSQRFVEGLHQNLMILGKDRSQMVFDYYDGYVEL